MSTRITMSGVRLFIVLAVICGNTPMARGSSIVFNSNTVIAEGDFTHDGKDVTVSGCTLTVNGPHAFNSLNVTNVGKVRHSACTASILHSLDLTIGGTLAISADSSIDVSGRGYLSGYTTGNTTNGATTYYCGGSYGGRGGFVFGYPECSKYGDARLADDWGAGGGGISEQEWGFSQPGGVGGGRIRIVASALKLNGAIRANGADIPMELGGMGGGGAGGGICIQAGTLEGAGQITANGGRAEGSMNGAGGGGGRIAVYTWGVNALQAGNVTAAAGFGDLCSGEAGTVRLSSAPFCAWRTDRYMHGSETIAWTILGLNPFAGNRVECEAVLDGRATSIASGAGIAGSVLWNTAETVNGAFDLRLIVRDPARRELTTFALPVLVNNRVIWHGGSVTGLQTWAAASVHVLESPVVLLAGAEVTVEPGAVVKFPPNTGLTLRNGATLTAVGHAGAPVTFTALADDTAGGDANLDGERSRPVPGGWSGITIDGGGVFNTNGFTELRYTRQEHGGTLAVSETWRASLLHVLSGDVTVPEGVTLTIEPGAVIKAEQSVLIRVLDGALLTANGTPSQPIIFTSLRDDTIAGDNNFDGDDTVPAAGDWRGFYVRTAAAVFDHCWIRYAGGSPGGSWYYQAAIRTDLGGSLAFSNSVLKDSYWDGLICKGGGPATIVNSLFTGNDRAIWADQVATVRVVNCTFYDNRYGIFHHGGNLDVVNTIAAQCLVGGIQGAGSGSIRVRHSNVFPANVYDVPGWKVGTNGNLSADPKFRNASNDNFRLNFGSSCLDAADGLAAPATDNMDVSRYTDPRSPHIGIPCTNGEYADMGAFEFIEDADSPVDLIAAQVEASSAATAGDTVTVRWRIANMGTAPVSGAWHDQIALVADVPSRGVDRVVVKEALSVASIGPGESGSFEAQVRVPGGTEGPWRWQVTANARGEVFEGRHWRNNVSPFPTVTALDVPALTSEVATVSSFAGPGQASWFKFTQPAGVEMLVTLDAATESGRCRLYAGFGSMPTVQDFDQRNTEWNAPDARMGFAAPVAARTVYLLVMPETFPDALASFTLTASVPGFGLIAIDLNGAGNRGDVTVPLRGSGFSTGLTAALIPATGGLSRAAITVTVTDSANALATFPLAGAAEGVYHLRIDQGAAEAVLSNAFTVVTGGGGHFYARLVMPAAARFGRPFAAAVEYGNDGDADVAVPLLIVESSGTNPVWLGSLAASDTRTAIQFPAVPPEGISGGALRPGEHYTRPFYSKLLSDSGKRYTVTWINGDAPALQDWNAVRDAIRPDDADAYWDYAWMVLADQTGPTVGDYIAALVSMADELRGYGLNYLTTDMLLWFMMDKQLVKCPGASLAGTLYRDDPQHPLPSVPMQLAGVSGQVYNAVSWYDGAYAFRNMPGGTYTLTVPGYLPSPVAPVTVGLGERRDVVVEAGASLAGRVVAAKDGAAIEGATVEVVDRMSGSVAVTPCGDEGRYAVGGLLPSLYDVRCSAERYVDTHFALSITGSQTHAVNFSLATGGGVQGVVLAPGGGPVSGAMVRAVVSTFDGAKQAICASNGVFALAGLAAGRYTLSAVASNCGVALVSGVAVSENMTVTGLVLTLTASAAITGVVTDVRTGLTVAGAEYGLDAGGWQNGPLVSDAQGRFTLGSVTPGTQTVWCVADGYLQQTRDVILAGGSRSNVSFALRQAGRVEGTVALGGVPSAAGVTVMLCLTNGGFLQTETDGAGHFRFEGLADGEYDVAIGGGFVTGLARQHVVLNAASNQVAGMALAPVGIPLTGKTLRAGGGSPAPGVRVGLGSGGRTWATTVSDAEGRYGFYVLGTGRVDICAAGDAVGLMGITNVTIPASGSVTGKNFVAGTSTLQVTCQAAGGGAVTSEWVTLRPSGVTVDDTFYLPRLTDASGRVIFSNLTAQAYRAEVAGGNRAATALVATVTSGSNAVVATLSEGGILRGKVRDETGQGLACVVVSLRQPSTGLKLVAQTDADGVYELAGTPLGACDMWYYDGMHVPSRTTGVVLVSAVSTAVDALLRTDGVSLRGRVTGPDGRPVPNASVMARDEAGLALLASWSDVNGDFLLSPLAGPVSLTTLGDGLVPFVTNVTLSGTDTVTNNPALSRYGAIVLPGGASLTGADLLTAAMAPTPVPSTPPTGLRGMSDSSDIWTTYPRPKRSKDPADTDAWRTSYLLINPVDSNCKAFQEALNRAKSSHRLVESQFLAWESQFEGLKDLNKTALAMETASAIAFAAKVSAFVVALEGAGPLLAEYRIVAAFTESEKKNKIEERVAFVASAIGLLQGIVTGINSAVRDESFDRADAGFSGLMEQAAAMMDAATGANLNGTPLWSTLNFIISCAKDLKAAYADLKEDWDNSANAAVNYYGARDAYRRMLGVHAGTMEAVKAAATQNCPDCKDKCSGCPPKPGQPEPKPNRCCGKTQPCPPPPCRVGCGGQGDGGDDIRGVGSIDPNDKQTIGYGAGGLIRPGTRVVYLIRFENKTNATAAAQQVTITDPLGSFFDLSTLELRDIGFNRVDIAVPPGLTQFATNGIRVATDPNPVRVTAGLDPDTGVLHWLIESVDEVTGELPADPLAGFLPPNATAPQGEGYVTFAVNTRTNLPDGLFVTNMASIVFDVNEPIVTPTTTNLTDSSAPVSAMEALPPMVPRQIPLQWNGYHTGPGGVVSYDIYGSRENEPFTCWLSGVTGTTASVEAEPGVRYRFFAVARDGAGNAEPIKTSAEAETRTGYGFTRIRDVAGETGPTNHIVLHWESATGKTYRVLRQSSLNDTNTMTVVAPSVFSTPPETIYTDSVDKATLFYRIDMAP
jgi:hypothetical protein